MADLTPISILVGSLVGLIVIFLTLGVARYIKHPPEEEEFTRKIEELKRGDSEEENVKTAKLGWFKYWANSYFKTGRLAEDPNGPGKAVLGIGVLGALIGGLVWPSGIIGAIIVGFGFVALVKVFFNIEANKRSKSLEKQLPLLITSLRAQTQATATPVKALMAVADELPSPIADEMRLVRNDLDVNIPLEVALKSLVKRVNSREIKFLAASIETVVASGENLDKQLQIIEEIVIQRQRSAQRLATAVSEVSVSLWVSGFIIPVSFLISFYQNETNQAFWGTLYGIIALLAVAGLYAAGLFISFRLVKSVENT